MKLLKEIGYLLHKELLLEWRQKYAFNGILLYVGSTVMLVYMAFAQIESTSWLALFWIILLFASVNAVAKSFLQEKKARHYYYYSLCNPVAVIFSKIIYNVLLLLILASLALACYVLLLGNPVANFPLFVLIVLLGSLSFSITFTIISAITAQAGENASLMPILSFPIIIPLLSLLIIASKSALIGINETNLEKDIMVILAIDGMLVALSFILFPYLWSD